MTKNITLQPPCTLPRKKQKEGGKRKERGRGGMSSALLLSEEREGETERCRAS